MNVCMNAYKLATLAQLPYESSLPSEVSAGLELGCVAAGEVLGPGTGQGPTLASASGLSDALSHFYVSLS